jgi:hypothetical protein
MHLLKRRSKKVYIKLLLIGELAMRKKSDVRTIVHSKRPTLQTKVCSSRTRLTIIITIIIIIGIIVRLTDRVPNQRRESSLTGS